MKQTANSSPMDSSIVERYRCGALLALSILAIVALGAQCPKRRSTDKRPTAPSRTHLFVRGYMATAVGANTPGIAAKAPSQDVYLPGVGVFLKDASSNVESAPTTTDLSGRFTLKAPSSGRYRVCWKAKGFVDDCSKDIISLASKPVFLSTVRIQPDRKDRTTVIFGKVKMKDGSHPRRLEPLANVNAFARVALLDATGNPLQEVFVNNFDEYLLPKVPVNQAIILRTQIEKAEKEQRILPAANLGGALFHSINLAIDNIPPHLNPIVATDASGRRVKTATPGMRVFLKERSSDKDGDPLKFRWQVAAGSGTINTTDAPTVEWKLPGKPGLYSITLMAWDQKGGYAVSDLSLRTNNEGIPFSGKVLGTDTPAIAGAEVEVNGQKTVTGPEGIFSINVKDADRFVLNIRKPNYALVSKIYDDAVTGAQWTMTRATVVSVNPEIKIDVVDRRDKRNCPGPAANRLDWGKFPQLLQPQWQDGKGNLIQPKEKLDVLFRRFSRDNNYGNYKDCGPGARVEIPANSLEDKQGNRPTGAVDILISTIDLRSPEQMPGDYTVRMPAGATRVMQSYGAAIVEISSGAITFNLKPGTTADLTIPVDQAQLIAGGPLPPTIPVLFYDEQDGVWIPEGTATLVGNAYLAKVKHFTPVNTDVLKVNQSCVSIKSPTLPVDYDLEFTVPDPDGAGAAPIWDRRHIDNDPPHEHVIYNLPSDKRIVLVPIRLDSNTPIGTFVVDSGAPQDPTDPNLPVGPPYYESGGPGTGPCSTEVTLAELVVQALPPSGEFLHGLYTFEATNFEELNPADPTEGALLIALDQATENYYLQIDPRGKRSTLDLFKSNNGFAALDVRAAFANSGDLGFGRDMHCTKQLASDGLFDVACYVSNYGNILTDDLQDAIDAAAGGAPVATVAMEFSRIESPPSPPSPVGTPEFDDPERVVKFYVYNSDGTQLLNSADLDSGGVLRQRPIPQLCMVCHNGVYPGGATAGAPPFTSREETKLGSRFIPFDLHYYTFAPAPNDKASQQEDFQQLNELVKLTHTQDTTSISAAPNIIEIINDMYTAPPPLPEQDENFVVAGWNAQPIEQGMYRDVVARTCRTCHAANIFGSALPSPLPITFDQASQVTDLLGKIESRVCVQGVMPHAKRTHDIFWTSLAPYMPSQLQVFGDTFETPANEWNGELCGDFTPGGGTVTAFYTSAIQPIWDGVGTGTDACTGCHIGGSPPAGLSLTSGNSYPDLFNQDSSELPSMKRVLSDATPANNAAQSYVFHKISGTHGSLPGCPNITPCFGGPASPCGAQMPCGGAGPMNAGSRTAIENWINTGAPGP